MLDFASRAAAELERIRIERMLRTLFDHYVSLPHGPPDGGDRNPVRVYTYYVGSLQSDAEYTVKRFRRSMTCTCPDFVHRGQVLLGIGQRRDIVERLRHHLASDLRVTPLG